MKSDSDTKYDLFSKEYRHRLMIGLTIFSGFIAVILLVAHQFLPQMIYKGSFYNTPYFNTIPMVAITLLFLSSIGLLMIYLQTGFKKSTHQDLFYYKLESELKMMQKHYEELYRTHEQNLEFLMGKLTKLDANMSNIKSSTSDLDEKTKTQLIENLKNQLKSETSDDILAEIQQKVQQDTKTEMQLNNINKQFAGTLNRLRSEIESLGWRANLNLAFGTTITIVGLGILFQYIFFHKTSGNDPWLFVFNSIPRLTLVVFIEIFAYFFLRLYKSGLYEIKYFQNEMTNIEAKAIAFDGAITSQYGDTCETVIKNLALTERNHVLEKGQTTVDLEKARLEQNAMAEIVQKLCATLTKSVTHE